MILIAVLTSVFGVLQTLISTPSASGSCTICAPPSTASCSACRSRSSPAPAPARSSRASPTTSAACRRAVTSTATSMVSNITSVVATIVAMVALDWRLAVVALVLLPLFVWIRRRVGNERKRITTQRQGRWPTCRDGHRVAVGQRHPARPHDGPRRLAHRVLRGGVRAARRPGGRVNMAGRWRMSVVVMSSAMPAAHLLDRGHRARRRRPTVSVGTLVAFVSLQQRLFRPTVSLLSAGVQIQTSLALFQRIFEYLDLPVDITEPERPVHLTSRARSAASVALRSDVGFTLRRADGPASAAGRRPRRSPAGPAAALVGADRRRQDHARLPGAAAVRRHGRPGHPRRGRRTRPGLRHAGPRSASSPRRRTSSTPRSRDNLRFAKPDATDEELDAAARAAQIHDHIAAPARRLRHGRRRARPPLLRR